MPPAIWPQLATCHDPSNAQRWLTGAAEIKYIINAIARLSQGASDAGGEIVRLNYILSDHLRPHTPSATRLRPVPYMLVRKA